MRQMIDMVVRTKKWTTQHRSDHWWKFKKLDSQGSHLTMH